MKKGLLHFVFIILLVQAGINLMAQRNICVCCGLHAIDGRIMDNSLFPPAQIAAVRVKEAVITTRGTKGCNEIRDSNTFVVKKTLAGEYTEFNFRFNTNGTIKNYVRSYEGMRNHIIEFTYRNNNKLVTTALSYIDSAGKKTFPNSPGDLTDFYYNDKMKLVGEKKRGYAGNVEHDDTANFYRYTYDNKNLQVSVFSQNYLKSADLYISRSTSTTVFSQNGFESTTRDSSWSNLDNKTSLQSTCSTSYDSLWRPLKSATKFVSPPFTRTETFEYNKAGKLIVYKIATTPPLNFECPEDGNYTITYDYNRFGLPVHIKHCYADFSCDMEITYLYY